eukprot:TRINITY_DN13722_c0_g1_i15.p1 TRINITY_DN13722_c0_g1~~TRINITY_DN13722_c0_g1_i15.p1  ORF type:complete len:311 (+),score=-9.05 TRINITY_DN13722_c0_g1_i15:2404-3336(+)
MEFNYKQNNTKQCEVMRYFLYSPQQQQQQQQLQQCQMCYSRFLQKQMIKQEAAQQLPLICVSKTTIIKRILTKYAKQGSSFYIHQKIIRIIIIMLNVYYLIQLLSIVQVHNLCQQIDKKNQQFQVSYRLLILKYLGFSLDESNDVTCVNKSKKEYQQILILSDCRYQSILYQVQMTTNDDKFKMQYCCYQKYEFCTSFFYSQFCVFGACLNFCLCFIFLLLLVILIVGREINVGFVCLSVNLSLRFFRIGDAFSALHATMFYDDRQNEWNLMELADKVTCSFMFDSSLRNFRFSSIQDSLVCSLCVCACF